MTPFWKTDNQRILNGLNIGFYGDSIKAISIETADTMNKIL